MLAELPHGSGIDSGMKFLEEESTDKKLVFQCDFHHMDENGYYDGWTIHKVIITPTFGDFDIRITGKNKRDIKTYLTDIINTTFCIADRKFNLIEL